MSIFVTRDDFGGEPVVAEPGSHDPMENLGRFRIPPQVNAAFNFVSMCNQSMGLRAFPGQDGMDVRAAELHPAQEGCFRSALECLSRYFKSEW